MSGVSFALRNGNISLTTSSSKFYLNPVNVKTSLLMSCCWEWFGENNRRVISLVLDIFWLRCVFGGCWCSVGPLWPGCLLGYQELGRRASQNIPKHPKASESIPKHDPRAGRAAEPGNSHCFAISPVRPQDLCGSRLPTDCEFPSREKHLNRPTTQKIKCDEEDGSHTWRNTYESSNFIFVSHWKGYIKNSLSLKSSECNILGFFCRRLTF